ncbi:hypothetical protein A6764_17900 [Brevibacillus sp. WF146]|uniref:hypothetical protein n=1 Tax=Brevibacillus sp. WF146 TaxID=319501 RepID=UPI0007EDD48F|nr:hypothetical protein [Brevibacillus sp. WF146]UYZ12661.1 hypothetical protein A6764_17900 [Brevibacillus sp. WF146]
MRSREYADTIIVNLDQIRKIERAQREMYDSGLVRLDSNRLMSVLGTVSSVLGLAFVTSTPAGIVAGITGILASITPSAKDILEQMVYKGYWELGYMEDFLVDNPQYDRMEIELPFIEFDVNGKVIRFISGKGIIKRVHSKSGWIVV